jgi:hypothetical protein
LNGRKRTCSYRFDEEELSGEVGEWDKQREHLISSLIGICRLVREAQLASGGTLEDGTRPTSEHHEQVYHGLQLQIELRTLAIGDERPD